MANKKSLLKHVTIFFTSLLFLSPISSLDPLTAALPSHTEQRIHADIKAKKLKQLGTFLNNGIEHSHSDLLKLQEIAHSLNSNSLLNAIHATYDFKKIRHRLGLSTGEFLQIAFYIETTLKNHIKHKQYYIPKNRSGLPRGLEYDPASKTTFIILDGTKSAFLGEGAKKTAYKSIEYKDAKVSVVARAEQADEMEREFIITRKLKGAPGLFEVKGFGHHTKNGKKYTTIYSKLYTSGNLRTIFKKRIRFTTIEKMTIALNILQGLKSMHERGIVHRDFGAKNFFVSIHKGKAPRHIEAVIADFGWSNFVKDMAHKKAQANYRNIAPEGFFLEKMHPSHYFATDVYAVGLVLYQLFYEEKASWQKSDKTKSPKIYAHNLIRNIDKSTNKRRSVLAHKHQTGNISHKERFEYLILRMVSPYPHVRGGAAELHHQLHDILEATKHR